METSVAPGLSRVNFTVAVKKGKTLHAARFNHETETARGADAAAADLLADSANQLYWGEKGDETVDRAIIFADSATVRLASNMLLDGATSRKPSEDPKYAAGRRFAYRASQPHGYRLVVLTDLLNDRFYAPVGVDVRNIDDWADAFGVKADARGLARLAHIATETDTEPSKVASSLLNAVRSNERNALALAVFKKLELACAAFEAAGKMIEAVESIHSIDPLLAQRNNLSGASTSVTYSGYQSNAARIRINGNCNFKEGEDVWLASEKGSTIYPFRVSRIYLQGDVLHADLAPGYASNGLTKWQNGAARSGEAMRVMSSYFFNHGGARTAERVWSPHEPNARVEGREVPVSIAVAGAPVG